MTGIDRVLDLAYGVGGFRVLRALWPRHLAVVSYHRVIERERAGSDVYPRTISADPGDFALQMQFAKEHYNVVSAEDLRAWLHGKDPLPPYPLLITFDDGYQDNFDNALPILRALDLPALMFLTSGHIGSTRPYYWDLVAYCFSHTERDRGDLPVLGKRHWRHPAERDAATYELVQGLKQLPDDDKRSAVDELADRLGVAVPDNAFKGIHMTWDQVRSMHRQGIAMGAHTQTHPILTRIPPEEARRQIVGSKERIEAEIGEAVTAFAYPNGLPGDFNDAVKDVLTANGIDLAFTLMAGPTTLRAVRQDPLTIRRIYIGYNDTLPRFAAKLAGLARLAPRARQ